MRKIELELRSFTSRNFEKPADCKNPQQVRFYINELSEKVAELREKYDHVPDWVFGLLAQYCAAHNRFMLRDFQKEYAEV